EDDEACDTDDEAECASETADDDGKSLTQQLRIGGYGLRETCRHCWEVFHVENATILGVWSTTRKLRDRCCKTIALTTPESAVRHRLPGGFPNKTHNLRREPGHPRRGLSN